MLVRVGKLGSSTFNRNMLKGAQTREFTEQEFSIIGGIDCTTVTEGIPSCWS